jgi:methylated-DNA-[protein]-cysteine S-methyltransferase
MSPQQIEYAHYDSPVGNLLLAGTREALQLISFPTGSRTKQPKSQWVENHETFVPVIKQLQEYFDGKRQTFDLPLELIGTDFQKQVWTALADIPYGETVTYGDMAKAVNRPKASRAVGAANGANNLPIILPCHRVIGANRTLTGFGGGLPTKKFLLRLEQRIAPGKGTQGLLFD